MKYKPKDADAEWLRDFMWWYPQSHTAAQRFIRIARRLEQPLPADVRRLISAVKKLDLPAGVAPVVSRDAWGPFKDYEDFADQLKELWRAKCNHIRAERRRKGTK